ncbi:SDR family NAD(P)-dependent oxidoreductase [Novosphingobium sp. TH158]|uniref:SDR family NAD(P)-dependent oxidoreductase n=1 Tax=Novosphingobium sp. TH158 TaxID=2067455 RepID=UPI000C7C4AF4|nr:SDR family NAD(P)-dependent oxidoreductase [Novosphingobium sp. TH158]PLK26730.1 short-chain dehydrogenase [Novosphingobium sp. TH158]
MAVADVTGKSIAQLVSLAGKTAVVTGGAQGLGRAIASRLAEAGATVVIGDLNLDVATAAAAEIATATGSKVSAALLDVTDADSVAATAQMAAGLDGGIDIWVNNAGIYPNVLLEDMTSELWTKVMDINLKGTFLGSQEAARRMTAASKGGVIVNLVSTAGFGGMAPGVSAYVASKHGVLGLIKQLAVELAPKDIRVLGVAPTFCTTEGNSKALAELPDRVREEISATLTSRLGRVGVPDDIARVVLFCASDLSMFMTGSTLLVDAGEVSA